MRRAMDTRTLERIGYTLILFASIVFASILVFVGLVAFALVEPFYSITNVVEALAPVLVISSLALTGGIVAVVAAKVREAASSR